MQTIKDDDNKQPLIVYQNMISKTFSDVFEVSKKLLLEESIYGDDIKKRISDKAEKLKEFGKGAK